MKCLGTIILCLSEDYHIPIRGKQFFTRNKLVGELPTLLLPLSEHLINIYDQNVFSLRHFETFKYILTEFRPWEGQHIPILETTAD